MKSRLALMLLFFVTISQVACSKQWRENYVQMSSDEVLAQLEDVSIEASGYGSGYQDFADMAYEPGVTIYYANAPVMGPPAMIASILDFSFMYDYFTLSELTSIQIFFLDFKDGDYHSNALLIDGILTDNTKVTDLFWGEGRMDNGQFVVDLVSDDGAAGLTVKSNDVSKNGELNGAIQLKSYLPSGTYIGKFSTLAGYR